MILQKGSIEFLGHTVNGTKIKPAPSKLRAIEEYPEPNDIKGIKSFIGFTSFYRQYVPNYATIVAPLTDLTRKNNPFIFGAKEHLSFMSLKEALINACSLNQPDLNKTFVLRTDEAKLVMEPVCSRMENRLHSHQRGFHQQRATTVSRIGS